MERKRSVAASSADELTFEHRRRLAMLRLILAAALMVVAPAAYAADAGQMEQNKKVVLQFYEAAINQKDFDAAAKFLGPRYTQHNPKAADGPEGLKAFLAFLRDKLPDYHSEIKRVFADGDYVILHVHNVPTPGSRGNAIIDIFRLENGRVVEHWDVRQEIPEQAANSNTMF
jgi:predicted SnoaL-like aldol condensation-catalyzing enzyme